MHMPFGFEFPTRREGTAYPVPCARAESTYRSLGGRRILASIHLRESTAELAADMELFSAGVMPALA